MNDPFELNGVSLSIPDILRVLIDDFKERVGALCLCRNWTNPLLWSHYADKHKGICLGFEIAPDVELQQPEYVARQQQSDARILIKAVRTRETAEAAKVIAKMLLTKFEGWSYEDEVRLLVRQKDRNGKYCYYKFGKRFQLCSVILGVRCVVERSEIDKLLVSYPTTVRVFRTALDFERFAIVEDTAWS